MSRYTILWSVWMFVLMGLALYWSQYQYLVIFALRLNINIFVWMLRYLVPRIDAEIEYQILFGCSLG
jgi:hypothetical protein